MSTDKQLHWPNISYNEMGKCQGGDGDPEKTGNITEWTGGNMDLSRIVTDSPMALLRIMEL